MITLEDWALIRRLYVSEKLAKAEIARQLGISRNTVAKAIASTDPPEYERAAPVTLFAPFEQHVRQLLGATPSMPATVLAERVGWEGSPSWFRQNVAAIRPDYAPTDPADRIVYHPGDQVQCDLWFPEPKIPIDDGSFVMLPVLVMVASFSKFITALMIPSRTTADLLAGMWSLLTAQLGAVPRRLIWDNETGIGRRNRLASGVGQQPQRHNRAGGLCCSGRLRQRHGEPFRGIAVRHISTAGGRRVVRGIDPSQSKPGAPPLQSGSVGGVRPRSRPSTHLIVCRRSWTPTGGCVGTRGRSRSRG